MDAEEEEEEQELPLQGTVSAISVRAVGTVGSAMEQAGPRRRKKEVTTQKCLRVAGWQRYYGDETQTQVGLLQSKARKTKQQVTTQQVIFCLKIRLGYCQAKQGWRNVLPRRQRMRGRGKGLIHGCSAARQTGIGHR